MTKYEIHPALILREILISFWLPHNFSNFVWHFFIKNDGFNISNEVSVIAWYYLYGLSFLILVHPRITFKGWYYVNLWLINYVIQSDLNHAQLVACNQLTINRIKLLYPYRCFPTIRDIFQVHHIYSFPRHLFESWSEYFVMHMLPIWYKVNFNLNYWIKDYVKLLFNPDSIVVGFQ